MSTPPPATDTLPDSTSQVRSPASGPRHGSGGLRPPTPKVLEALVGIAEHVTIHGTLPTLAELGQRLGVERSSARQRLRQAVELGLVVHEGPHVRRGYRPTDEGWRRIHHRNARVADIARSLVEGEPV